MRNTALRAPAGPRSWLAVLACCAGLCAAAHGQSNIPVPRAQEESFRESEVTLPEYPQDSSLVRFPTDASSHRVYLDAKALAVGADRVVRFTLVVRTAGGAENVSFEGLRCDTGQRRVYAFGRKSAGGGAWTPARSDAWLPIRDQRVNRYYFEFWRDLFCDGARTETREEILRNAGGGGRVRQETNPSE